MLEKLERLVDEIGVLHSRLVLLVGPPESGKTRLLRLFGESRGIAPLNLGSALGRRLIALSSRQRPIQAAEALRELIAQRAPGDLLLFDNLELLFDETLKLDPLDLLRRQAQTRRVVAAYIAEHGKARLGVAEDKTKTALRKDARLASLRTLAGISLMPTPQLAAFESRLDGLKSCFQLSTSELSASPICPHCGYKPANESLPFGPVANALTQLDEELDRLLAGWRRTLLDNLAEPSIRAKFDLLKTSARDLIQSFVASQTLPDPVTPVFVGAAQEAFSGLEKITVTSDDIRQALLAGGSPATPEELRRRFETFLAERCKGKDTGKLRFIIE